MIDNLNEVDCLAPRMSPSLACLSMIRPLYECHVHSPRLQSAKAMPKCGLHLPSER